MTANDNVKRSLLKICEKHLISNEITSDVFREIVHRFDEMERQMIIEQSVSLGISPNVLFDLAEKNKKLKSENEKFKNENEKLKDIIKQLNFGKESKQCMKML